MLQAEFEVGELSSPEEALALEIASKKQGATDVGRRITDEK